MIGVLWEYPLAFQRIVTWRDKVPSLDLLSGRIYGELGANNVARIAMRKLMATKEQERAALNELDHEPADLAMAAG